MSGAERLNASTLLDRNLEAGRAGQYRVPDRRRRRHLRRARIAERGGRLVPRSTSRFEREQRVLMILDDSPAFPATFLGAMRIGAVPVPVNPMDRVDNYVYYLDDSYAQVLVVEASLLPALEPELESRLGLHVLVVDGDPGPHAASTRSLVTTPAPAAAAPDRHPPRGHGVLALQLGLDRAAEGRRPRSPRHRRDRRAVRAGRPADLRRRRVLFDDEAVPRVWPGERAVVPAVGGGVRRVGQGPLRP